MHNNTHKHTHTKRYHFHWITSGKNGRFPRALGNEEGKILFFPVCCVLAAFQAITFENPLCLFFWITFHHFLLAECFRCVFYFSSIYLLWCRSLYGFWIFRSWFFKCYCCCAWFIHSFSHSFALLVVLVLYLPSAFWLCLFVWYSLGLFVIIVVVMVLTK